jgi:hypothetical protein
MKRLRAGTLSAVTVLTLGACSSSSTDGDGPGSGFGGSAVMPAGGVSNSAGASVSGGTANAAAGGPASAGAPSAGTAALGGGAGTPTGGASGSTATGGAGSGGSATGGTGGGNSNPGTCTASKATGANASGSGSHKVTVETNTDAGINEGTIFRPTDLGGSEKYPIFVWGEGGCSQDGMSNAVAMAEIASHGYFVIADGTSKGAANRALTGDVAGMGKPLLAYVDWAVAENGKPCSAYHDSLDTTKIASNGFSCGGLMAEGTAADPRLTTWGLNSSGLMSANQSFYKTVHTPVLIVLGGASDIAYENGERDYDNISALGIPIILFSKDLGHGGDLFAARGGDFTKIDLAWLNWQLKGDTTVTGKGLLVGAGCSYCSNSAWEVKSKNLP